MLKSLRKYKQWILVIGGSLLMIAFLIPDAMHQIQGDPMDREVGTLAGRSVSQRDLTLAERELNALKTIAPILVRGMVDVENGEHWFLLKTAASEAGLIGGSEDGRQWVPELARDLLQMELVRNYGDQAASVLSNPQLMNPMVEQMVGRLEQLRMAAAGQAGMTETQIDQTLANARGVARLAESFRRAARFSDAAVIHGSRRLLNEAKADVLVIPAERVIAEVPEPSQEQLQAHFEQYKTARPGEGMHGFGYLQPPRVKLAWLQLDRAALAESIKLSPIDVRKRYEQNRTLYTGEFAQARANVEKDLRDERVREVMADAERVVQSEVRRATRKLESEGAYKRLPPDWAEQRPRFDQIASAVVDAVKAATGVTIPLPSVSVRDAEWLTFEELQKLPGLGEATARIGSRSVPLPSLVLASREINGPNELGVQAGVPLVDVPIVDAAENRYFVMVLDARPEEPPSSLEDVREQVVKDVRLETAFARLLNEVQQQQALASLSGPEGVAQLYNAQAPDQPALTVRSGLSVSRQLRLPENVDTPEFRDAVVDAITKLDPLKPAHAQDAAARTVVVGMPGKLAVGVAQISEIKPLTAEMYRQAMEPKVFQLQSAEFREAMGEATVPEPFSYQSLKQRLDFELLHERKTDAETSEPRTASAS